MSETAQTRCQRIVSLINGSTDFSNYGDRAMEQAPGTAGDSAPVAALASQNGYHTWQLPDRNISVRLRLDVVERLEREVICAYKSIPKRGAEAGGVLLGRIDTSDSVSIVIDDVAAVPCEYRRGPSYFLSESDVARLEAELKRYGTSVVGFYRSHTRQDFDLDEEDRTRVRAYLPRPANAFLLIKPLAINNCLGNLFFWDGREIHTDRSWGEFRFGRFRLSPERVASRANNIEFADHAKSALVVRHVKALQSKGGGENQRQPESRPRAALPAERAPAPRRRLRWVPIAACLMFALSALLGFGIWNTGLVQNKPSEAVTQSPVPTSSSAPPADSDAAPIRSTTLPGQPAHLSAVAQPQQLLTGRNRLQRDTKAAQKSKARNKKRGISRYKPLRKAHHQRRNSRA